MRSMQVRATQLQDATTAQFEQLRARSRELRLRVSDLQAREQQLRESRYQTPVPERATIDRQWLNVRHDLTAATIELEGVNEQIAEIRAQRDQAAREQAQRAATLAPPRSLEPPAVEAKGLANAATAMVILFIAPFLIVLAYRLATRNAPRDPIGLESSPRFQRMEQTIDSIAMEVESIAEAQRFTTRILAERHPESTPRSQASVPRPDTITPR